MRVLLAALAVFSLTSCGGGGGGRVTGDIGQACMAAGRSAANPALCACVQQVASQTLSASDQARVAGFFAEPDLAQEIRVADGAASEAFWRRYRQFTETAEGQCGG
jgi:hypothetical protein